MTKSTLSLIIAPAVAAFTIASLGVAHADEAERALAAENFIQADVNVDNALTFDEFTTFIDLNADDDIGRAGVVRRFGRYETAFGRIDANEDGFVTPEELAAQAEANN